MAVRYFVRITCEGIFGEFSLACLDNFDFAGPSSEAIQNARKVGWLINQVNNDKSVCPHCIKDGPFFSTGSVEESQNTPSGNLAWSANVPE